mmetsp:Transcript_57867/g.163952  ORF Transcript_57867/g.163952 Transcript_57867/m.163952 type:complete len:206 (+) Transcript_57867:1195-1812(+)
MNAGLRQDAVRHRLDHAADASGLCQPRPEVGVGPSVAQASTLGHEAPQSMPHLGRVGSHEGGLLAGLPPRDCGRVLLLGGAAAATTGRAATAGRAAVAGNMAGVTDGFGHLPDLRHVDVRQPAAVALVIDLEEPGADVGELHDEARQRGEELILVVNVSSPRPYGKLGQLRQLLAVGLGGGERHVPRPGPEQRQVQGGADFQLGV